MNSKVKIIVVLVIVALCVFGAFKLRQNQWRKEAAYRKLFPVSSWVRIKIDGRLGIIVRTSDRRGVSVRVVADAERTNTHIMRPDENTSRMPYCIVVLRGYEFDIIPAPKTKKEE